jgi:hypothetical protein
MLLQYFRLRASMPLKKRSVYRERQKQCYLAALYANLAQCVSGLETRFFLA